MTARINPASMAASGLCIGCGACVGLGGRGHMDWDANGQLKPVGLDGHSDRFARICPFSPLAADEDRIARDLFPASPSVDGAIGRYEAAFVGHAAELGYREEGSSGGMANWVAGELLQTGAVDGVAHVVPGAPDGRFFRYRISRTERALRQGAQSRYYPVEIAEVLREIRAVPGRYAIIGIPCFIKAVHLAQRQDPVLNRRIVHTLGLFCGHMKSRHMVESFAWQMGLDIGRVAHVDYRVKNPDRPANWYTARLCSRDGGERRQDWWHLVDGDWGSGFFQNPACDYCDDVVGETADISFGDAWVEPYSSDGRGTNVVVIRSPQLLALIERARSAGRLALDPVDAHFVAETQAAGFRQRREGLAYRLTWRRRGIRPRKRVRPGRRLPLRRKLIYRCRHAVARGSVLLFRLARWLRQPWLFLRGGRAMLNLYQGLTYSRGRWGKLFDRLERYLSRAAA